MRYILTVPEIQVVSGTSPDTDPNITINYPNDSTLVLSSSTITIDFTIENFVSNIDGHINIMINNNTHATYYDFHNGDNSYTINNLTNGSYTITFNLADNNNNLINVSDLATFMISLPEPDPEDVW